MCSLTFQPRALVNVSERMLSSPSHRALVQLTPTSHAMQFIAMLFAPFRPVRPMRSLRRTFDVLCCCATFPLKLIRFSAGISKGQRRLEKRKKRAMACCHTSNPRPIFLHPVWICLMFFFFRCCSWDHTRKSRDSWAFMYIYVCMNVCMNACMYICMCIVVYTFAL